MVNNEMLKKEEIDYAEHISKELISELVAFFDETQNEEFYSISSNFHRARFNRLRIELGKILIKIKNKIYN